ncbi:hypothetical protein Cni_G26828 [Canna indica]|uniref:Uncharacterized protein n=1 Tax=Canna indica TaxID=4628 RepID=A0AAQ3L0H6_9LILI|nr:hypothetical protein Cni_G26828 [Canna indica]
MDNQAQKSAAESGLLSPPPPPPPLFNGDCSSNVSPSECDEKEALREEEEGEKSYGRRVSESGQPKLCVRGHWRPSEDAKLKELVARFGPQNWNMIAEKLEGRSGKSCRLRWFNQLDPRINRKAFSAEEEERLLAVQKVYGNKWALIARLFPGRTDNAVKNQWHVMVARKQREQCSDNRRRKAAAAEEPAVAPSPLTQVKEMSNGNNAWSGGESTITSNRDESASTCTGLPLYPASSSSWIMPCYLKNFGVALYQQPLHFSLGGINEKCGECGSGGLNGNARMVECAMAAEQFGYSDASSEASATESAALLQDETDGGDRNKITVPFIDFLGIGAT